MKEYKLMITDDNKYEIESFKHYFSDYDITAYTDPKLACKAIDEEKFNLILIDICMQDMNGLEFFKHLKESKSRDAYTIAYTGLTDRTVYEVISELGFDEIVEKPANFDILKHKIKMILGQTMAENQVIQDSAFTEDKVNFDFILKGSSIGLTYKEYEILKLLIEKKNEILTHQEIYDSLYGKSERSENIIKSHMKNLRCKIAKIDSFTEYIRTIHLKGYKLID
jgi:DNA-binding response OmpR family regulator